MTKLAKTIRKVADLGELSQAEKRVLSELDTGQFTILGDGRLPSAGDETNKVRASLLRILILRDDAEHRLHERGLEIVGAWVSGDLDLESCRDLWSLSLISCRFEVSPKLRSVSLANLIFSHSHLPCLVADRLETQGSLFLRDVESTGEVLLGGAKLGGELDCTNAKFRVEKDAKGNSGYALFADRLQVNGNLILQGARISGQAVISTAQIKGNLLCQRALDGAGGGITLILSGSRVDGVFLMTASQKKPPDEPTGQLILSGAHVHAMDVSEQALAAQKRVLLNRFEYDGLVGESVNISVEKWLSFLKQQYVEDDPADFYPQPHEQLARVLREAGHWEETRKVLVEKERLIRAARVSRSSKVWGCVLQIRDWFLNLFVRYGLQPLRAALFLAGFWILGARKVRLIQHRLFRMPSIHRPDTGCLWSYKSLSRR